MTAPTPNSPSVECISDPILPFVTTIPGGIFPGKAITIRGSSSPDHPHQFSIDLCCGLLVQGDHKDNKALHFNPRFIKKKGIFGSADEDIVLNSLINNRWGPEERTGNCLRPDGPFTIRILVLQHYFKIAVNGKHLSDFVHRIPFTSINTLYIQGAAKIDDVPFVHSFRPGSLNHTKTITLTATPKMHATVFTFNLMKSGDYFFHLRVDFPHHGKSNGALVRNHCINNKWASEERVMSHFPFTQGITFDLKISLGSEYLNVELDGKRIFTFSYRPGIYLNEAELDGKRVFTFSYRPGIYLNEVNIVSITGDLNIQKFELK
uniref:Galectin n=1 Tax=Panagrolaimus sp. ES5 TaxID=591445 RepID=A0AC34FKL6_9BILA